MKPHVKTDFTTSDYGTDLHLLRRAGNESDIIRDKWIEKHSRRLLRLWLQRQTPLGVALTYAKQIEKDLARLYEDPLKRKFIEKTYG